MRVLWFSTNSANYIFPYANSKGYNGGGWTSSLQREIIKKPDIVLGVCFCCNGLPSKDIQNGVTYYPVPHHQKAFKDKILDFIHYKDVHRDEILWPYYITHFKKVIEDFKPDVIEVFGSELYIGLAIVAAKGLPVVLHLQGLLSLSLHAFFPPGVSHLQYIWKDKSVKKTYANVQNLIYWKRSCHREKEILKATPYVIGRTEWDKAAMRILAPQAQYYYGGEILRPEFYEFSKRHVPNKVVITTTISHPPYKGFDLVLKTAYILKVEMGLDFEWNVFGNVSPKFWEKHTGINHNDVNVVLCGVASAQVLRESLLQSALYFHPSYVENSPNSVAEAQILGTPVVATNVGGTSSMIEHNKTGLLFPATDPYMGVSCILNIIEKPDWGANIGNAAKEKAILRHDKKKIIEELITTYNQIIQQNGETN